MRKITVAMLLLAFLSIAFARDTRKNDNSMAAVSEKKITTISESVKAGKPSIVFFTKSVACDCTKKNCAAAEKSFYGAIDTTKTEFSIVKIDVSTDDKIAREYKIVAPPSILILDKNGKEAARLNSWEITAEKLNASIAKVQDKKPKQNDK